MKVAVQGQLTTFISDRRVSEVSKSYLIELQYAHSASITIKSFKETNDHDPLETKTGTIDPATRLARPLPRSRFWKGWTARRCWARFRKRN